jgi:hypothetical protein
MIKRFPGSPLDSEAMERNFTRELRMLDRFNRDAMAMTRVTDAARTPDIRCSPGTRAAASQIDLRLQTADRLAIRFQRRSFQCLRLALCLGLCSVAFFRLHEQGPTFRPLLIPALSCLTMAYGVYLWSARIRDYQNRYQDYRALAEAFRVQYWWTVGGIRQCVQAQYPRKCRGELGWIRRAMLMPTMLLVATKSKAEPGESAHALSQVVQQWVSPQVAYYRSRVLRDRQHLKRIRLTQAGVISASLATAAVPIVSRLAVSIAMPVCAGALLLIVLLAAWRAHPGRTAASGRTPVGTGNAEKSHGRPIAISGTIMVGLGSGLATLLVGLVIGAAGLKPQHIEYMCRVASVVGAAVAIFLYMYSDKRAFVSHLKQYERMAAMFGRVEEVETQALQTGAVGKIEPILIELGREALAEHMDWLATHRERPIEVPSH